MVISKDSPRNVGTQIRDARKAMRWSQAELGKRMAQSIGRHLPFSQASVSDFERGAEMPTELLEKLPGVFDALPVPMTFASSEETPLDDVSIDPETWKRANNLRDEFPNLLPLSDDDLDPSRKLYLGLPHIEKINELLARSGGTEPVFVRMSRGHGCSTLSRFIYRWVRRRAQARQRLPIYLALDKLEERKLIAAPYQTVEETLRIGIAEGIAQVEWHPLIPEIALPQFSSKPPKLTEQEWEDSKEETRGAYLPVQRELKRFHEVRAALRAVVGRGGAHRISLKELEAAWPALSSPLPELLVDLQALSLGRILSVELIVDLSSRIAYAEPERYDRAISALQVAMTSIRRDPNPVASAMKSGVSEIYVGHSQSFEALEFRWERSSMAVEYPWYHPHDVFGMLAYHYIPASDEPEESPGDYVASSARDERELLASVPSIEPDQKRIKALATKLGSEHLAGIVVPEIPLVETGRRLKNRLFRSTVRRNLLAREYEHQIR
jgi:transcriptional regulator with XRE-family HTH domain